MLNNENDEYLFDSTYSPKKCFKYFSQEDLSDPDQSYHMDNYQNVTAKNEINLNLIQNVTLNKNGSDQTQIKESISQIDFDHIDAIVNYNQAKIKELYFNSQFEEMLKYLNLSYPEVSRLYMIYFCLYDYF